MIWVMLFFHFKAKISLICSMLYIHCLKQSKVSSRCLINMYPSQKWGQELTFYDSGEACGEWCCLGRWSRPGKGLECYAHESGLDPRGSRKSPIVNQCSETRRMGETRRMVSLFFVSWYPALFKACWDSKLSWILCYGLWLRRPSLWFH